MIKIENNEIVGWEHTIRGMRNPMNSWAKSDSRHVDLCGYCGNEDFEVGENDFDLMMKLSNAGTDHSKFLRMIVVYVDITAPLYWWKEFDTYKIGTVRNSCSTMHKIHSKEFTMDDFSCENMLNPTAVMESLIDYLNINREAYLKTNLQDKQYWWNIIQLLPSSYNQTSTVMLNYQVLKNMYHSRKNHKLDEWREFCRWVETLPYSELITGEKSNKSMEEM